MITIYKDKRSQSLVYLCAEKRAGHFIRMIIQKMLTEE